MIDVNSYDNFHPHKQDVLRNPDTDDPLSLAIVPGAMFGRDRVERFINKYRQLFHDINAFCMENGVPPLFPNPDDVTASLIIRNSLVDRLPEEYLNKYFGVERFSDYDPPRYDPNENNNT